MKYFRNLFLLSLALSSVTCFADNGKPDLWKFEKQGNVSYLFGSIHLGSQDMYPMSDRVIKAYQGSDELIVEIDIKPSEQTKMASMVQQYGVDTSIPLEKRLSTKGLVIYEKACKEKSLPCQQFSSFKAWLLSVQITAQEMQKNGYSDAFGIDKHFLDRAHKTNKPIISLETVQSQLEVMASFSQQLQELMLIQSLQTTKSDLEMLFSAWKTGDDAALDQIFRKDFDMPLVQELYVKLIESRNFDMVKKIENAIAKDKSAFVVVGAGHIVGDNGLVDLLRKDGYKLTAIQ